MSVVTDVILPSNIRHKTVEKDKEYAGIEIMKGGHVRIQDDGVLIQRLSQLCEAGVFKARYSSHYKMERADPKFKKAGNNEANKQSLGFDPNAENDFSIQAPGIFNEGLFGFRKDEQGKLQSWFQFEGHSHFHDPSPKGFAYMLIDAIVKFLTLNAYSLEKAGHHGDFVVYKATGENVGQHGTSKHVDQNPLVSTPKGVQQNPEPARRARAEQIPKRIEEDSEPARREYAEQSKRARELERREKEANANGEGLGK